MPTYRYVVADVFTDTPLTGNQLAVFTDARGIDDGTMQALALEIGFSETVFVLPAENGGTARIRIFNPRAEMPFAGHPTLGTAFVLGAPLQLGVIALETGVGIVPVSLERDESGRIVFGRMTQPVPRIEPVGTPERVLAAVGAARSLLPVELYDNGARHVILTVEGDDLATLRPDGEAIAELGVTGVNCVAAVGDGWRNRMFWANGEDPATGSAAGPIACHLARHGRISWGEEIVIAQGVEMGRPSALHARADGGWSGEARAGLIDAVEVGGAAVVVARGEFRV
jgi:trans-2,3-dihydro-3-hydroxyanthranilate isomerase